MVVVEKHEHKSEWWSVNICDSWRIELRDNRICINEIDGKHPDIVLEIYPPEWPVFRAAIGALYAVWQEQREAGE